MNDTKTKSKSEYIGVNRCPSVVKPYPKYKNSGIEWLGEIPEHWESAKLKRVTSLKYGDSLKEESRIEGSIPVYGSNGIVGKHDESNTESPCIIVGRKGSYGKVNYSLEKVFAIDTTYFVDSVATKSNLKWLFYCLSILGLDSFSKDSAVPGLSREDAYDYVVPLYPVAEQQSIAAYLDRKTALIDKLVSIKEKQIELLKEYRTAIINHYVTGKHLLEGEALEAPCPAKFAKHSGKRKSACGGKDSGIKWLGEIPEHWEVKRFKSLCRLKNKEGRGGNDQRKVALENIESWTGKFVETDSEYEGTGTPFDSENVLFGKLRPYLAKVWLSTFSGLAIGDIYVFETQNNTLPKFILYRLLSKTFIDIIDGSTFGAKMPRADWDFIQNLPVPKPSFDEQQSVAAYLDKETAKIAKSISDSEKQIVFLKEYRTALISEAVTGKIDVRGITKLNEGAKNV